MTRVRPIIESAVVLLALGGPAFGQGGYLGQEVNKGSNWVRQTANGGGHAVQQGVNQLGRGIARVDPTTSARRELERLQAQARSELPRIRPDELLNGVREAMNQPIAQEIRSHGAAYNANTGDLDLRGTSMGRVLQNFAVNFAQGNQRYGQVDQFLYNVPNRRLTLRLTVRHHQRAMFGPLGEVDIYDDTQHAGFGFDFGRGSAFYDLDFGGYIPPYTSQTYEQLSEGDLVGAAESLSVPIPGQLVKYIRQDEYAAVQASLYQQWGQQNVYLSSKTFVDWASPDTLAKYAVNGVLSFGTSVYPEVMADVRQMAENEFPGLAQWAAQRGMANAEAVARQLLTGQPSPWPFIEFRMGTVGYVAYEGLPGGGRTPDRRESHLMFAIVWLPQGQQGGDPASQAAPGQAGQQPGNAPSGVRPLYLANRSGFQLQVFARWQNPETGGAIDRVFDPVAPGQSLQLGATGNPLVFVHVNYVDAGGNVGTYVDGNDATFSTPSGDVGLRQANATAEGENLVLSILPPS